MKAAFRVAALALVLMISGFLAAPQTANAWYRHYRHHHQVVIVHPQYHRAIVPVTSYGVYPNIRYFQRDGHVWAKNLDSGDIYIVRW